MEKFNEEVKWYSGKYDRCFKEVMLKEENKDLLKLLLEHILKVEIYEIEIKNVEKLRKNIHLKGMRTDLSLKTNIGYINVEVNSNPEEYVHPRNFAYLADTYSHDTLVNEQYDEKTMYIQINLSYGFMLTENHNLKRNLIDKEAIRIYKVQDNKEKEFIKNFIIYEINMDYYLNIWYTNDVKNIEKEKILVMLGLDKKSLEKLSKNDKVVSKYMKEVNRLNEDPEFREYISYEEDQRKIQNTLLNKAKEEGLEEKQLEISKNMLKNGANIELIIKSTGYTKEEVENIAKELDIDPYYREYISYEEDQRKIQNTRLNKVKTEIAENLLKNGVDIELIIKSTGCTKEEVEDIKTNL